MVHVNAFKGSMRDSNYFNSVKPLCCFSFSCYFFLLRGTSLTPLAFGVARGLERSSRPLSPRFMPWILRRAFASALPQLADSHRMLGTPNMQQHAVFDFLCVRTKTYLARDAGTFLGVRVVYLCSQCRLSFSPLEHGADGAYPCPAVAGGTAPLTHRTLQHHPGRGPQGGKAGGMSVHVR